MRQRTASFILVGILLTMLLARVVILSQAEGSSYESYETLIQIEHVTKTGVLLPTDPTSVQTPPLLEPPAYYYLSAFLSLFIPWSALGLILPSFIALGIVVLSYLLAFTIVKDQPAALYSAAAVAFLPVFFSTLFDATPFSFGILLLLLCSVLFLRIDSSRSLGLLLIALFLLTISHALSITLAIILLLYVALMRIEGVRVPVLELESIFLYTFLAAWANLLIYKKALLMHGADAIWQNIPQRISQLEFYRVSFVDAFLAIGLLVIVFGALGGYHALSTTKSRPVIYLTAFVIVSFISLWLRLVPVNQGLVLLGIALAITASLAISKLTEYLRASKIAWMRPLVAAALSIMFILTSVVASLAAGFSALERTPSDDEQDAMIWISGNTQPDALILTTMQEAWFVSASTHRKTLIGTNFLLIRDINVLFDDSMVLWDSGLLGEAERAIGKHRITHLYFSPDYARTFNKSAPAYIPDATCLSEELNGPVKIYHIQCPSRSLGLNQAPALQRAP